MIKTKEMRPPGRDTAEVPLRFTVVKDGFCPPRGHQSECSVLGEDATQNAEQLLANSYGGTCGLVALHPNPNLQGASGIYINRVWNLCLEQPLTVPNLPLSLLFTVFCKRQHLFSWFIFSFTALFLAAPLTLFIF